MGASSEPAADQAPSAVQMRTRILEMSTVFAALGDGPLRAVARRMRAIGLTARDTLRLKAHGGDVVLFLASGQVEESITDGTVPAAILAAAHIAGVDAVYRIGGAQAIAALAYGTTSIPRVDVVAGPGNIYVTLAKREVFGSVGVDGIAGPTEVMVIADAHARPDYVAADLAAQLEHDPLAWAVLITDSAPLADRVEEELESLIRGLERAEIIRAANCCVIVADDLEQAMHLANDFAPEHLLIVTEDPGRLATQVENAGAVFVGAYATVPLGDYAAGPNHTLPTSGAARFGSPLGVHTFMKRTSVLSLNRGDLEMLRDACLRLAAMEGLGAHAHAVEVRLE